MIVLQVECYRTFLLLSVALTIRGVAYRKKNSCPSDD